MTWSALFWEIIAIIVALLTTDGIKVVFQVFWDAAHNTFVDEEDRW